MQLGNKHCIFVIPYLSEGKQDVLNTLKYSSIKYFLREEGAQMRKC